MHCSVLASFPTPFPSNFVWTTNPPVRNKISEVNPGHLSSWLGLTQAGALHPGLLLLLLLLLVMVMLC